MTDTSHGPPNRAARRTALKTSRARRRKSDIFTLRQRRIERERDERNQTAELIGKRANDLNATSNTFSGLGEAETRLSWLGNLKSVVRNVRDGKIDGVCVWYIIVAGFLLGIVIGAILRMIR